MSQKPVDYAREVRDTVVKSSLTGVAATVLAVTFFSPAGFGGMVGTSLASGFGQDPNSVSADDPYATLPPFPAPLTQDELSNIQSELARAAVSLEITRAATEGKIEQVRRIAMTPGAVTFAPIPQPAIMNGGLRLTTSDPGTFDAPALATAAPPAPTPANYNVEAPSDPHLELAALLLAHETF
jgi:hypothetical protein